MVRSRAPRFFFRKHTRCPMAELTVLRGGPRHQESCGMTVKTNSTQTRALVRARIFCVLCRSRTAMMDVPVPPLVFPFIPDRPALREGRLLRPPAREMAQTRLVQTFDCTSCRCSTAPSGASSSCRRRGRLILPEAYRCRRAALSMRAAPLHSTSELALNSRQWRQAHRDEDAARCGVAAALPQRTSADAQRTSAEVQSHDRWSKWCKGGPGKPASSVHRA